MNPADILALADEVSRTMAAAIVACTQADEYLDIRQAAVRLGVNKQTLRAMCDRGELAYATFGRIWRVRSFDINALFQPRPRAKAPREDDAPNPPPATQTRDVVVGVSLVGH